MFEGVRMKGKVRKRKGLEDILGKYLIQKIKVGHFLRILNSSDVEIQFCWTGIEGNKTQRLDQSYHRAVTVTWRTLYVCSRTWRPCENATL